MGFKRTTEGRVFFQGGDNEAGHDMIDRPLTSSRNMEQSSARPVAPSTPSSASGAASAGSQAQIIALLQSLNAKLQSTQMDREKMQKELDTYKNMVLALQDKTRQVETESRQIKQQIEKSAQTGQRDQQFEALNRETLLEFEETRRLIAEIEERADRTESLVKKQQAQARQSEEQARIKWDSFIAEQKKQAQDIQARLGRNEQDQKLLGNRVDQSLSAAEKIDRKIEKAMQDRSRLIRKLERIEETVLQTNEALNARAMVLLTDQYVGGGAFPAAPALASPAGAGYGAAPLADQIDVSFLPWWKKPLPLRATSASLLVIAALLGGWFISYAQKPQGFDVAAMTAAVWPDADAQAQARAAERTLDDTSVWQRAQTQENVADLDADQAVAMSAEDEAAFNRLIESQNAENGNDAAAEQGAPVDTSAAMGVIDQNLQAIDLNDEEALLAALENDPDALAARLNQIEPTSLTPEEEQMQMADAGAAPASAVTPVSVPVNAAPARSNTGASQQAIDSLKQEMQAVKLPSALDGPLQARIQPDSKLPEKIREIEKNAFSGNAEAQHDLAAIYVAGHGGVKQDFGRAALWFEEAAHNGVANARYNLGVLHHQGIGVKQDVAKAFEWYKTAAALGHPEAQYNLGIAYIEGVGVPYDAQKAAIFFENAAKGGVMEAAYNLGLIYENGLLGAVQPDTALMWYKRAADKGSPEAKAALEQLAKALGMTIADVNTLIDGMDAPDTAAAQKKTEKSAGLGRDKAAQTAPAVISARPDAAPAAASRSSAGKTAPSVHVAAPAGANRAEGDRAALIAKVQGQLMDLGLYPGPVDGMDGMMTSDAVRSYQSRNDLPADGRITAQLLEHMTAQGFEALGEGSRE